jgi:hypothetical protein
MDSSFLYLYRDPASIVCKWPLYIWGKDKVWKTTTNLLNFLGGKCLHISKNKLQFWKKKLHS